jgi:hypothetical protein
MVVAKTRAPQAMHDSSALPLLCIAACGIQNVTVTLTVSA